MPANSSTNGRWVVLLCVAGLAVAAWLVIVPLGGEQDVRDLAGDQPANDAGPSHSTAASPLERPQGVPVRRPEPEYRIPQSGRLSIEAASLPEAGALALGLGLVEEDGGIEPLAVRVASVDGRAYDTTAVRQSTNAPDVRVEIDADWLQPGKYMIQIKTAGKGPLPLRRYVLEVR